MVTCPHVILTTMVLIKKGIFTSNTPSLSVHTKKSEIVGGKKNQRAFSSRKLDGNETFKRTATVCLKEDI